MAHPLYEKHYYLALRTVIGRAAFTEHANLLKGSVVSWQVMGQEFLRQFYNNQR